MDSETPLRPLVLVVGDIGAALLAGFVAANAGVLRFAHACDAQLARRPGEGPVVVVAEHAPPHGDAVAALRALGGEPIAVVLARAPLARDGRTQALGVRAVLPLATATVEDLDWAVRDALELARARQGEREHRALEESYRDFFECAAFGAVEISGDGRIARVNRKLCDMGGYAPEDMVGRPPSDFVHADDLSRLLAARAAFFLGDEKALAGGFRFRGKDGAFRTLRLTGKPVRDFFGAVRHTTGIVEDITEQIAADAALRASEERFRVFFDSGGFGAIEVALDGAIMRVNTALCDIFGRAEADLLGRQTFEFIHSDSRDAYLAARADLIRGAPDAVNRAWRIARGDGSIGFVRLQISVMRGHDGAPLYCFGVVVDMTEQIKAEEALRASEARYRAFFDNGAFGAFEGDLTGRLTNVNRCFAELGGYAPQEMIGRMATEFVHEEARDQIHAIREAFLAGRMDTTVETQRYRRKDGAYVWVRFRPLLVRDGAGAPVYMCGIAEDISEALKAETALRESEERLRKLSDNLPDHAVYTLTRRPDGLPMLSYISAGFEKISGVTAQEAIADTPALLNLAPAEYHAGYLEAIRDSERTLSDVVVELPIRRRDGRAIWIRMHSRPTRLRDGGVVWDGVLTEITDRKRAELALARNEAVLTAVLDGAQDAVLSVDGAGEMQSANAAAAAMFGYEQQDMIGRNIAILCAPCRSGQKQEVLASDVPDSRPWLSEGARKDGSVFPVEIRRFRSQVDGQPLFVDFLRDLSERRLVEARMEQLKEQRLAAMGGMAGALAHELNQPLAAITLHVETAQRLARLAPQDRPFSLEETLGSAVAQTLRAGEIVAHLRQFAARGEPDKAIQNLHALLREVCAGAPGKGRTELRLDAARDEVFIDKVQIRQICFNLIRNAFEAMATSADPLLTISTRNEGGKVILVEFSDRGPGVSGDMRDRLFEPLATNKAAGMGVGLSLSRAIASIHAGALNVSSNAEGGATFTLALPLHAES